MNIKICENDHKGADELYLIINEIIHNSYLEMNIMLNTNNPDLLINDVRLNTNKNCIYFLSVELSNNLLGIELAKIIRIYDPFGYIILVMTHFDLTLLTFQSQIKAIDYILRVNSPNFKKRISDCLIAVTNDFRKTTVFQENKIVVDTGCKIIKFNPDEIIFFETDVDHRIKVHTLDGQIKFYGALKKIQKVLPEYFYKVHRSYIVNTKHIKVIDKSNNILYLTNKEECYVSKTYMQSLINILLPTSSTLASKSKN